MQILRSKPRCRWFLGAGRSTHQCLLFMPEWVERICGGCCLATPLVPSDAPRISAIPPPAYPSNGGMVSDLNPRSSAARLRLNRFAAAELRRTRACVRPDAFGQGCHFRVRRRLVATAPPGTTTCDSCCRRTAVRHGRRLAVSAYGSSNLSPPVTSIQAQACWQVGRGDRPKSAPRL